MIPMACIRWVMVGSDVFHVDSRRARTAALRDGVEIGDGGLGGGINGL